MPPPPVYGQITYALPTPAPTNPIPTMSETLLIGMAISLALVAFKMTKKGSGGNQLNSLAAGCLALLVSLSGVAFIGDVNANGVIAYLSEAGGGVTNIEYANNEVHIINNSGKKQKILAMTPKPPATSVGSTSPYTPQCQVNDELEPNGFCYVRFDVPPPP